MKLSLIASHAKEVDKCYTSSASEEARMVGTGLLRLGKSSKPEGEGLYSMLFASCFHPEYILAC